MKRLIVIAGLIFLMSPAMAQKGEIYTSNAGAANGYDVVAYFSVKKPMQGKKEFSANWNGATWYFSSKENKEMFVANPEKYAPQYGGYCAYGTSEGHKAPTQPDAWTVVDNKLYFNYNKDVQVMWRKEQAERIKKADANWPTIKGGQ